MSQGDVLLVMPMLSSYMTVKNCSWKLFYLPVMARGRISSFTWLKRILDEASSAINLKLN